MSIDRTTDVVVIGGGQSGLAMSRCLTDGGVDHVVLERGETANAWRTERWDSLRLLTPNWMSRLPGFAYAGADPDGYMTAAEVAVHLDAYRRSFDAPMRSGVTVEKITTVDDGEFPHVVHTSEGRWRARAVVMATGAFSTPRRPNLADDLPSRIQQLAPIEYRNPGQIAQGRVLVVGASASGLQIADELRRAGRDVVLAVGEHVRLPRTYRGMDIHWWMDQIGQLDERYDEVEDIAKARRLPSLQLIGTPERRTLDIASVVERGVDVVGRVAARSGSALQCSGSLPNILKLADLKQQRLLDRCDEHATEHGLDAELAPPERPARTDAGTPALTVDLAPIGAIVWATGFRPSYPWLDPVHLDAKGQIVHDGGVLPTPGLYVMGLPFLRRRKSSFLDGAGPDAGELAAHLRSHLDNTAVTRR